jgi:hypothetical protein
MKEQGHDGCGAPAKLCRELNFCREQLAQVLVELTNRTGISTEKRKMAIDGLDRRNSALGISRHSAWQSDGGKNMSEDIGMTKVWLGPMRLASHLPCGGSRRRAAISMPCTANRWIHDAEITVHEV